MSSHSSKGTEWEALRKQVLERDGYLCQLCKVAQADTVDHIVPKARGGEDNMANCVAACRSCNGRKGARVLQRTPYRSPRWFTT